MGLKYDPKKNGSLESWATAAANDYIERVQEAGATPEQQETIDDIKRMMQLMLGMK